MGMPVQMPSGVARTIPDTHGIEAEHNGLAVYRDFCKVAQPRERLCQLACFLVMIA